METTYEIVVARPGEFSGHRGGHWDADGIGSPNTFASIEEAEACIASLRTMGDEWATATYAIREIGQLYPELGTIDKPEVETVPCAYCEAELDAAIAGADVPAPGDDEEWAALAGAHRADCEWIATRAHRRFAN